jgi:hypothetical protein
VKNTKTEPATDIKRKKRGLQKTYSAQKAAFTSFIENEKISRHTIRKVHITVRINFHNIHKQRTNTEKSLGLGTESERLIFHLLNQCKMFHSRLIKICKYIRYPLIMGLTSVADPAGLFVPDPEYRFSIQDPGSGFFQPDPRSGSQH